MKLAIPSVISSGSKRWVTFLLVLVLNMVCLSASEAQSISVQVNSYLKTQVKETTIRGAILVTENMTDWLSQADVAPSNFKKPAIPSPGSTPAQRTNAVAVKAKCPIGAKAGKRP